MPPDKERPRSFLPAPLEPSGPIVWGYATCEAMSGSGVPACGGSIPTIPTTGVRVLSRTACVCYAAAVSWTAPIRLLPASATVSDRTEGTAGTDFVWREACPEGEAWEDCDTKRYVSTCGGIARGILREHGRGVTAFAIMVSPFGRFWVFPEAAT
jgi:hypothetical protein